MLCFVIIILIISHDLTLHHYWGTPPIRNCVYTFRSISFIISYFFRISRQPGSSFLIYPPRFLIFVWSNTVCCLRKGPLILNNLTTFKTFPLITAYLSSFETFSLITAFCLHSKHSIWLPHICRHSKHSIWLQHICRHSKHSLWLQHFVFIQNILFDYSIFVVIRNILLNYIILSSFKTFSLITAYLSPFETFPLITAYLSSFETFSLITAYLSIVKNNGPDNINFTMPRNLHTAICPNILKKCCCILSTNYYKASHTPVLCLISIYTSKVR